MPSLTQVGDNFLNYNKGLSQLELPKLTQVGNYFLICNEGLSQLESPKLTQVGNDFLTYNEGLSQLELPSLTQVGDNFLTHNEGLSQLELPKLIQVGKNFLEDNKKLTVKKIKLKMRSTAMKKKKEIQENNGTITAKDIAQLDKEKNISTSELNIVGRIIKNIAGLFRGHER